MTSKIIVNNIEADAGVSTVTFGSDISANITGNVTGNLTGDVTGNVTGNATGLTGTPNLNVGIVTATSFSGSGSGLTGLTGVGKILQVQSQTTTTRSTEVIAANTAGTTKWLTVNITPSSTNSKIIIFYTLKGSMDYAYMGTILRQGTTPISVGTSPGQRAATTTFEYTDPTTSIRISSHTACFVDSPGVTSQLDYNVIVHNSDNGQHTFYANSTVNNADDATLRNRVSSSIIVAEYLP